MTFEEWFKALYIKTGFVSSSDELRMAWEAATAAERAACARVCDINRRCFPMDGVATADTIRARINAR